MRLMVCIIACFGAAAAGSVFTFPALKSWYVDLPKPKWTPPSWLFGPVWTALYLAMAFAAWIVWRRTSFTSAPMRIFFVQLLLNVAWSGFFFRLRSPGAAFVDIVLLWGAIVATTIYFFGVAPVAGWLMIPYLLWVTFAATLNFSIWRLNS